MAVVRFGADMAEVARKAEALAAGGDHKGMLIDSGGSERGTHRLMTFSLCPQLFAYEEILKLPMGSRRPLVLGSMVHVGLAHFFMRWELKRSGKVIYCHTTRDESGKPTIQPPEKYTDVEAFLPWQAAVERYVKQSKGDDQRLAVTCLPVALKAVQGAISSIQANAKQYGRVVSVEWPIRYEVGGRYVTSKADLVIERDGRYFILDHKTTGQPGDRGVMDRYTLSKQIGIMRVYGKHRWGDRFGGLYIHEVSTNESSLGSRLVAPDTAPEMDRKVPQAILDTEAHMEALEKEGRDPWDYPAAHNEHSCRRFYGNGKRCSAWALCRQGRGALEMFLATKQL